MESYLNFLDPPAFITPEDLSLPDAESFSSHIDPYTRDRTSHMRQHLSWIEGHTKGYYNPCPSTTKVNEPFSAYNPGPLSADFTMDFPTGANSIAYSHSDRLLSPPPCTGHPSSSSSSSSSSSGLDSPRSSNLGDIGSYLPLSYACDETMFPSIDNFSYPSPPDLTSASPNVLQIEPDSSLQDLSMGNETLSPLDGKLWSDGTGLDEAVQQNSSVSEDTPTVSEISTQLTSTRRPRTPARPTNRASTDGVRKTRHNPRSPPMKSSSSRKYSTTSDKSDEFIVTGGRQFICSFAHYGCTSTFSSKNEWKRHITSQHLQLGTYRCDIGSCNVNRRSSIDQPRQNRNTQQQKDKGFNRKDLFIQHLRRMHAPWQQPDNRHKPSTEEREKFEQLLGDVPQRCWHQQRQPPQHTQCGLCHQEFKGENSWDERMEHVGKHYERDEQLPEVEAEDIKLREWAIQEGILRRGGRGWVLASLVK